MGLVEVIHEQSIMGFTGRVNALSNDNKRFLGVILLVDGEVVATEYGGRFGERALYKLFLEDFNDLKTFYFVVEPEVVTFSQHMFKITFSDFKKKAEKLIVSSQKLSPLRPPAHIKLVVDGDFISKGKSITGKEFSVLCTISDYNSIVQIYNSSYLYEFEITEALISLRKKGAVRVVA